MKSNVTSIPALTLVPVLTACLLFYFFLGHRRDYLGHFAAGYGGTLVALALLFAAIPAGERFRRLGLAAVLPSVVLCIAGGAVAEATVFRVVHFDPIDFCNQSLGAVLAGLAVIGFARGPKPADAHLRLTIGTGAAFLAAGGYFAFT